MKNRVYKTFYLVKREGVGIALSADRSWAEAILTEDRRNELVEVKGQSKMIDFYRKNGRA